MLLNIRLVEGLYVKSDIRRDFASFVLHMLHWLLTFPNHAHIQNLKDHLVIVYQVKFANQCQQL